MGYPAGPPDVYDAATMRLCNPSSVAFLSAAVLAAAPLSVRAGQSPAAPPVLTVTVTRVVGAEAIAVAGNAPAAQPLEAALYAHFSRDLPDVLLSRWSLTAGAAGTYRATLPAASAFFTNAIVTVVVRSPSTGAQTQAFIPVASPNVPAPPDDLPASVR